MKKTGLEIIEMMAKGEAPKKIKNDCFNYKFDNITKLYVDGGLYLDLIQCLNDEFEIIEEDKVWKPKKEEKNYYITAKGGIIQDNWEDFRCEYDRYEMGNCFRTKEEANKALEKINIYMKLKRYAEEHNTEKIDFKNNYQVKYYLCYNHYHERIETENFRQTIIGQHYQFIGNIYFTDKEEAEQAIQEIGEDNIKKLFED